MRATAFEFRFRIPIVAAIVGFSIWSPGFRTRSLWSVCSRALAPHIGGMLAASYAVLFFAGALAVAGALLRTWATAYMGSGVVLDSSLHTDRVVAAGPYRYLRNPLYAGAELSFLGLAFLIPWWTGIAMPIVVAFTQYRLILAEEHELSGTPGYTEYKAAVPRYLPTFSARLPRVNVRPRWAQAFIGEIYFWGVAICFFVFASRFNAGIILQGAAVSFGVSLVVRALTPKPARS